MDTKEEKKKPKLGKANKIILAIWIFAAAILDFFDILTTMMPIGQDSVYESNQYLKLAIDILGPEIGILVFGPLYKICWITFFATMFVLGCRLAETIKDTSLIKERVGRSFAFGMLYVGLIALWLIKIPAIIGNTNPYQYT